MRGAAAHRSPPLVGVWYVCAVLAFLYLGRSWLSSSPDCADAAGASGSPPGPGAAWLDSLQVTGARVGYGTLGAHGALGFEGRCVRVTNKPHVHGLGMHPPAFAHAFAAYELPSSSPAQREGNASAATVSSQYSALRFKVAINDGNNAFGRAGSPLRFQVLGDGRVLWKSRGIQGTGDVQAGTVCVRGVRTLRLEVHAQSNACAHAVWIDPALLSDKSSSSCVLRDWEAGGVESNGKPRPQRRRRGPQGSVSQTGRGARARGGGRRRRRLQEGSEHDDAAAATAAASAKGDAVLPPAAEDGPLDALNGVTTFVMSSTTDGTFARWFSHAVPTMRSWSTAFRSMFFLLPHNAASVLFLAEHKCAPKPWPSRLAAAAAANASTELREYVCPSFSPLPENGRPREAPVVLLTAHPAFNCSDETRGAGACCQANFAMWYVLTVRRDLMGLPGGSNGPSSFSSPVPDEASNWWLSLLTDDVYVHGPGIARLLASVPHVPILGNRDQQQQQYEQPRAAVVPAEKCFRRPFRRRNPSDFPAASCLPFMQDSYGAHPLWLSRSALLGIEQGVRAGGIVQQCNIFEATLHETALGQFLWMYGIPCRGLPEASYSPTGKLGPATTVVTHRARRGDNNNNHMNATHRYFLLQRAQRFITAQKNASKGPGAGLALADVLASPLTARLPAPPEGWRPLRPPKIPTGYMATRHAFKYNLTEEWAPLTNIDCDGLEPPEKPRMPTGPPPRAGYQRRNPLIPRLGRSRGATNAKR